MRNLVVSIFAVAALFSAPAHAIVANSILDIYVSVFSWNLYSVAWDTLNGTGLSLIPFGMAIIANVARNYSDLDSEESVRSLEWDIFSMILVLIFCVIPYQSFSTDVDSVQYNMSLADCNPPPTGLTGSGGATGTQADAVFSDFQGGGSTMPGGAGLDVNRPVLWALVDYVSTAMTNTLIRGIGCSNNYEFLLLRMASVSISDTLLKERVQDFSANCYRPAIARWNENPLASYPANPDHWERIDWIGTTSFLNTPGEYYFHEDVYLVDQGRFGFTRDESLRQSDLESPAGTANPYCGEVWLGAAGADGLRTLLLEHFSLKVDGQGSSPYEDFIDWGFEVFTSAPMTVDQRDDLFLKLALQADAADLDVINDVSMGSNVASEESPDADSASWSWSDIAEGVGVLFGAAGAVGEIGGLFLMKYAVQSGGPTIVALLQMLVIVAAPILMVANGYCIKTFGTLAATYFSLETLNFIFGLSMFWDNRLLEIYFQNASGLNDIASSTIIKVVSLAQIFLMPLVWIGLMALGGGAAVRTLQGGFSRQQLGAGAQKGTAAMKGVASKGMR